MKKMMKSIVCIAIAAALVLSLAACGCGYANSPEGVVKRIVNASNNHDYVTMAEYYEEPDEDFEERAKDGVKDLKSYYEWCIDEGYGEGKKEEMGDKAFKAYINAQIEIEKAEAKRYKVEIDDVEKDGDEAWVEYTVYYPDWDEDDAYEDALDETGLDEDEEEDWDEKEWAKFIKAYKKYALKEIKDADLEDYEAEIRVVKDDGKWKIAEDQSKED